MTFTEFAPIALSIAAVVISVLAWRKSRVIYEIVTEDDRGGKEKINNLLKTGVYTILHVQSDPSNSMRTIYTLGKLSKRNNLAA